MDAKVYIDAFENYKEAIYRFVYFKLGQNKQLAEDIASDVFLKAWEKRHLFNADKSSVKTWLYVIARRVVIDNYRKEKKLEKIDLDDELINEIVDKSDEDSKVLMQFILNGLNKLTISDKELIVLRFIEGLDLNEIAEITGRSYDATKMASSRALNNLRSIIEPNAK